MSQKKVDERKAYKKNRKEILAREKRMETLRRLLTGVLIAVFVFGLSFSFYRKFNPVKQPDPNAFYYLTATDSYGILKPSLPTGE